MNKGLDGLVVLPLFLYFDDFRTDNALGSHAGKNKIGGTYISTPCYPPEFQSSLSSIFMALVFYPRDRVEFGNISIFKTLIKELNFLEK